MGSTRKRSISVDNDTRKEIAGAVAEWPVVGKTLAFLIRRGWWAAVLMLLLFFLIVPLVTPLLSAVYVKMFPAKLHDWYADSVIEAYGVTSRRSIENTVAEVVAKNNANLDFVQQFHAEWSDPAGNPARVYRFPLKNGQDFDVEFRAHQPHAIPCTASDPNVGPAGVAVQREDLFQISVNRGAERYSTGAFSDPENRQFRQAFWKMMEERPTTVESPPSGTGSVEVTLNKTIDDSGQSVGRSALLCYSLAADLRVIVYKSILTDFSNLDRAPARNLPPESAKP